MAILSYGKCEILLIILTTLEDGSHYSDFLDNTCLTESVRTEDLLRFQGFSPFSFHLWVWKLNPGPYT